MQKIGEELSKAGDQQGQAAPSAEPGSGPSASSQGATFSKKEEVEDAEVEILDDNKK